MNKVQKLKFATVEDLLEYLPHHERQLVEQLRALIFSCLPDAQEKLAYNVPFYWRHGRICFIWPASVPWGKVPENCVTLGFCQGPLLQDEIQYLEKADRQQVYTKTFARQQDIDPDLLKAYVYEAALVDEQLKAQKPKKKAAK